MSFNHQKRLVELYKKTGGGHLFLTDTDFEEYRNLRKQEFVSRRTELEAIGTENIVVMKDDAGDIIGWCWTE